MVTVKLLLRSKKGSSDGRTDRRVYMPALMDALMYANVTSLQWLNKRQSPFWLTVIDLKPYRFETGRFQEGFFAVTRQLLLLWEKVHSRSVLGFSSPLSVPISWWIPLFIQSFLVEFGGSSRFVSPIKRNTRRKMPCAWDREVKKDEQNFQGLL